MEVHPGSITEPESLAAALKGITHVVHCAGCTRARRVSEYYTINHLGTRHVVAAVNAAESQVQRLVLISSLAVAGPATPARPAREEDPPNPVSHYGKSKAAGELEVRQHAKIPYTILRPPVVYGPRDQGFLPMFKAVGRHILPSPNARQELSLVFVRDLAEAVAGCLLNPAAAGRTYFVASPEFISAQGMARMIAQQMRRWTVPLPLPTALLWPICLAQQIGSQLTGRAALLNLQKFAEIRAPGWVCDPSRLQKELGLQCPTPLKQGVAETLKWYQQEKWL